MTVHDDHNLRMFLCLLAAYNFLGFCYYTLIRVLRSFNLLGLEFGCFMLNCHTPLSGSSVDRLSLTQNLLFFKIVTEHFCHHSLNNHG